MLESLLNKLYLKDTPAQVLSCEFCEIFKNSFFYRTPPVATFVTTKNTEKVFSHFKDSVFATLISHLELKFVGKYENI